MFRSHLFKWRVSTKAILAVTFCIGIVLLCPQQSLAASLSIAPSSGTYQVGDTFTLSFSAQSPSQAINAVSGTVSYSSQVLELVTLSKTSSIISLWVKEPTFSNTTGTLTFEGITLNPGFTGQNGNIVSATFRVKALGTATVAYDAGSILANDGNGTELLAGLSRGTYTFSAASVVQPKPIAETGSAQKDTPALPVVTSGQLQETGWLSSTTALFQFTLTSDVTAMRLLLDDNPHSTPIVVYKPPITSREIVDIATGTSYLHVQYQNQHGWGDILHLKLQVDTTVPSIPKVAEIAPGVFTIQAEDQDSGVTHYDVVLDNNAAIQYRDTGDHRFVAPKQAAGSHTLTVTAFDAAGNSSSATISFETTVSTDAKTEVPQPDTVTENQGGFIRMSTAMITILSIVIPCLALVITLGLLLFFAWRSVGGLQKRIDREAFEAKATVRQAFMLLRHDLEEDIQTLEKAGKKRKLTREEAKILKRLNQNLNAAEQVILKEVDDIEQEIHQ